MDRPADLSRVTAIVVNWNAAADCVGLVESLSAAFAHGLRMVIFDNGSADGSAGTLRAFAASHEAFAGVEVLESAENAGFCEGVNRAVAHVFANGAPPEFILLLNPDGAAGEGLVEELVAVSRLAAAGVVCAPGELSLLGAWPNALSSPFARLPTAVSRGRWRLLDRYSGACALFRADLVRQLVEEDGYFLDPKLFMYWDEWDASLRIRGYGERIAVARDAEYEHFGYGRSSLKALRRDFRTYYIARNALLVARAHLPRGRALRLSALYVVREASWSARSAARGRPHQLRAQMAGWCDGLRGKGGPWKKHPKGARANH